MPNDQLYAIDRAERGQHAGLVQDVDDAQHRERRKPHAHDRPEQRADEFSAAPLKEKNAQDDNRDRHHVMLELRRDDVETFDRAENRDGGRDHAVAVEQRGREDAEHGHEIGGARILGQIRDEREQREASAFAAIVGPHDDRDIFQRYERHDGPEHQGDDAEHPFRLDRHRMLAAEGFLDCVKGTRADIAEDDADRPDDESLQVFGVPR